VTATASADLEYLSCSDLMISRSRTDLPAPSR
jgi:hypothetical protein